MLLIFLERKTIIRSLEVISGSVEAEKWCKIKLYNKVKNDVGDAYLYNITVGIAMHEYNRLDYNIYMICYIEKEDDIDKGNLIDIRDFQSISGNAT